MVSFMLFLREIYWTVPAFDVFEVWVMKGVRLENEIICNIGAPSFVLVGLCMLWDPEMEGK